ncbi:double-CXXCG motif protein [Myxococcus stipitatus]|nr:double-CXXCG motif protein [Myxococcus stipitatus]
MFRATPTFPPRSSWGLQASSKWWLPGIHCPTCDEVWSGTGEAYPSVDLSSLAEHPKFTARVEEDFEEFTRLRELVRPLAPEGAVLEPGANFGPLVGTGRGTPPPLFFATPWQPVMQREALEQLQSLGLQGLLGCRTELRLRSKAAPELLELQLESRGELHPTCLPRNLPQPCSTCGRLAFSFPSAPLLDWASLPTDRDLFRLSHFKTAIIATERFIDAVRSLDIDDVQFRELPAR